MAKASKPLDDDPPAGGSKGNTGQEPVSADDMKTEQEKGGKDPVGEAKDTDGPAETMKLAPREPYPTGSPPDPEEQFKAAHGYSRAKE